MIITSFDLSLHYLRVTENNVMLFAIQISSFKLTNIKSDTNKKYNSYFR